MCGVGGERVSSAHMTRAISNRHAPPQLAEDHQYYETLVLPYEASSEEVRRAYRKAAIKYHPDKQKGGAEEAEAAAEQFRRVALAHRVLSDPQRRARYNEIITLCWEVAAEGS